MRADKRPVRLLASVTNESEASLVAACGSDIIDCKDPAAGALGALPLATVARIVGAVGAHCPISATIGDLPADPESVAEAAGRMAETGVDFIKIGFFPGGDVRTAIARLGPHARTAACGWWNHTVTSGCRRRISLRAIRVSRCVAATKSRLRSAPCALPRLRWA